MTAVSPIAFGCEVLRKLIAEQARPMDEGGVMVVHTRSDHPHHLAQVAASLAGDCAERLDMEGDALDGAEQAALLVAAQDAMALLREALDDD